ncbi:MAG: type II secretion system F family protein [Alphaproteobacteria bacterium]|nr:type II secretion system F family protein [Alphaproteobacteria bacterium]
MAQFTYSALNERGRRIRGSMVAENDIDLEARLKEVGLDLITYREQKHHATKNARIKMKDMIILSLHLEQLSRAGVPIHEAIADVRDSTESTKMRDIMTDVLEKVKAGSSFSAALASYPRVFNDIFVGLVAAGEKNGNLTESFVNIGNHMKWTNDLRRKVKKAITYPVVLLVVMSAVIAILMMAVVPKLLKFITEQGFAIPLHTRALIFTSEAFQSYWYLIFGIPIGLFILGLSLYRTMEPFAYKMDGLFLRIPVIGQTLRKIDLARFTHFFSVMFKSGINIPEALLTARNVVKNRVIKESIDVVHRSIVEGNNLTSSLRISNQFPTMVIRMFKVGEDSGSMGEAMGNIKFFYDREVNDSVDALVGMIQPILTLVMGILIFWVIAAVFGPLYQSFSQMKF